MPNIVPNNPDSEGVQEPFHQVSPIPPEPYTGKLERLLHGLFLLILISAVFGVLIWLHLRTNAEVISQQSIGRFIRMSAPGGLSGRVVIETEVGSYPLRKAAVIFKGTPLIQEVRASGDRFVCDLGRSLCIETVSDEFRGEEQSPKSFHSGSPSVLTDQSKGTTP